MCAVNRPRIASCLMNAFSLSFPCFSSVLMSLMASRRLRFSMSFDEELHDLVERELLPDQVGAHAHERDDLGGRRSRLEVEEAPVHRDHPVAHLLKGFLDLRLAEGLLLSRHRLFRAALDLVEPRCPGDDMEQLEIPLLRQRCSPSVSPHGRIRLPTHPAPASQPSLRPQS